MPEYPGCPSCTFGGCILTSTKSLSQSTSQSLMVSLMHFVLDVTSCQDFINSLRSCCFKHVPFLETDSLSIRLFGAGAGAGGWRGVPPPSMGSPPLRKD